MRVSKRLPTTFVGFDSAWANNPKAPGAICAAIFDGMHFVDFTPPELVNFDSALAFIRRHQSNERLTLVALDQPTIVVNSKGMRPVERLVATIISWLGGGVQPSNKSRIGMFCPASPIWRFLESLKAVQEPVSSRSASHGLHLIEVFPALALPSLNSSFFGYKQGPRYNPKAKTFRVDDFEAVTATVVRHTQEIGFDQAAEWVQARFSNQPYKKSDQDRLDAIICLLIAILWRFGAHETAQVGDLETGYMITPMSHLVRNFLVSKRAKHQLLVPID